ncbi:MAG TPA: hypothetical protein VMO81_06990 [Aestuariivirgaceae bacterium]|nr:hypothetical protein [Aestuariivirgaceae bacterium]
MAAQDEDHSDILRCVKSHVTSDPRNEPIVLGIGPVTGRNNGRCAVIVKDPGRLTGVSSNVRCRLRDGRRIQVQLDIEHWAVYFQLFGPTDRRSFMKMGLAGSLAAISLKASPTPRAADLSLDLPRPPSAELMGGDGIFNHGHRGSTGVYWGTIAFVASQVEVDNNDGTTFSLANAAISAAHVIDHGTIDRLGTYVYPDSGITRVWTHPDWVSKSRWRDLALASIPANVAVRPERLRGFGMVRGTRVPDLGQNLVKFGATTEVTKGRELGLIWRRVPESGPLYLIRAISGRFAARGDSGAAVVNLDLKLAGLVVGAPTDPRRKETWYMPVLPLGATPPDPELSYVRMEFS